MRGGASSPFCAPLATGPRQMMWPRAIEGALVTLCGVVLGAIASSIVIAALGGWVQSHFGIALRLHSPSANEWSLLVAVLGAGWLASGPCQGTAPTGCHLLTACLRGVEA